MRPVVPRLESPTRAWRSYVLEAFSGDPDGAPEWIREFENGDDSGFFGPGSAVWAVHSSTPVIVAGIRALLLQTLHPGAMAGVHDWSRYREDPLGRLAGTVRWVLTTSFADRHGAEAGSAFVRSLHARVRGTYRAADGHEVSYAAGDPDLVRWVHVVFADSFLRCHETWGENRPGLADDYVREWASAGELMGVNNPPRSETELRRQLASFDPELVSDERVASAVSFIRRPPIKRSLLPAYRVLFAGAVATLDDDHRKLLGLHRPGRLAIPATRLALSGTRLLLGRESEAMRFARRRLERLSQPSI